MSVMICRLHFHNRIIMTMEGMKYELNKRQSILGPVYENEKRKFEDINQ